MLLNLTLPSSGHKPDSKGLVSPETVWAKKPGRLTTKEVATTLPMPVMHPPGGAYGHGDLPDPELSGYGDQAAMSL